MLSRLSHRISVLWYSWMVDVLQPDTCADDLDAVEMANIQLHELSARGLLFEALESALADGEITRSEEDLILKLLNKHLAATQHSIECVISLNKRQ